MSDKIIGLLAAFALFSNILTAHPIVVAADGSGDFTSIQAAIQSLPDSATAQRTIFIKKGVYREKLFIDKSNILLIGESNPHFGKSWTRIQAEQSGAADSDCVLIVYSESREIFRCGHPDDWGAAAMNVRANDIALQNLLIVNDFGFNATGDSTFICDGKTKVTRKTGHQFALRCMPPTQRLTVKNCNFHSLGGDTVSPWDVDNGTFEFYHCTLEGDVDFYCPRGWAYAEDCFFICHNLNAAIWHDGTGNEGAKTVLKNCTFTGDKGFKLGRFHRDAQFYLINCRFSEDMADEDIYKVRKDTNLVWGKRVYYYNCRRDGAPFPWFKNNISPKLARRINRNWTLKSRWNLPLQPAKNTINYSLPKVTELAEDTKANRMLIAQRAAGGWPKTLDGKTQPPPYENEWNQAEIAAVADEAGRNDATIDNNATTTEIYHLSTAYNTTKHPKYKAAAEKGIGYLLAMQHQNGGFPQFFPDTSGYRKHITFNDDAMIRALELLQKVAEGKTPFEAVGAAQREQAHKAVEKGIDCILKTQIRVNGQPTVWCAQHHYRTLEPVKARAYELPSFSGKESVAILSFLMKLEKPTPDVVEAVRGGVNFLEHIKVTNTVLERIKDENRSPKEDVVVRTDPNAPALWARFYDLDTQKPFFCGRDGIKKDNLAAVEYERRVHYAWYGDWAKKLIERDLPKWIKKWGVPSTKGITQERDTSYSNFKAYQDVKKTHPQVAWVDETLPPSVGFEKNIPFRSSEHKQLMLDAFYPKAKSNSPRPAILIIHGGGWRTGSREQHQTLAQRLAALGYVCFTPEYRLSTHALFPAAVHDLKAAVRWARANATAYQIDTNKIVALGFSAGGELAAFLGTTGYEKEWEGQGEYKTHSSQVNAVVDLDGILSFIHPESGEGDDRKKTSAATHWLGYSKIENPDLWRAASPLTHISANTPPTLFINSSVARMHAGQNDYVDFLKKQNTYTQIQTFPEAPHSFVQFSPWFEPMVGYIDGFLKKVFH